jgi:hypothetical protein
MIGDHHGRTAGRATLLVRAVDDILGTHSIKKPGKEENQQAQHPPRPEARPG